MISWIQNKQKHLRIVFIVLLVGTIISFVFITGNSPGIGQANDEARANRKFFDFELDTQAKEQEFGVKGQTSARLQLQGYKYRLNSLQEYIYDRATALHLADLHKIPNPTAEELESYVQSLATFQNASGEFDPLAYSRFLDEIDANPNASRTLISTILNEDFRVDKVYRTLSGPNFVIAEDALGSILQSKTEWSIAVANWDISTFKPTIEATTEDLESHYQDTIFQHMTPERRTVKYVEYPQSDYTANIAPPTEDEIQRHFIENRAKYAPPPSNEEGAETPETQLEDVRGQVIAELLSSKSMNHAQEAAEDLVLELIESNIEPDSEAFAESIAKSDKELKETAPFANYETPIGTSWPRTAVTAAFKLTPTRYYSDPIQMGDKTLVLFIGKVIEAEKQDFEHVVERVRRNYELEETRKLSIERGAEIRQSLAAAESEAAFVSLATELGLTTESFADFTARTPAEGFDRNLGSAFINLPQGEVSEMITRGTTGSIVYVTKKNEPEISRDDPEFTATMERLDTEYEREVVALYIQSLRNRELDRMQGIAN